jgi:hypothetical protein
LSAQHTPGQHDRPNYPARWQRVIDQSSSLSPNWERFNVECWNQGSVWIDKRIAIRATKDADLFVDISIEEYTGETRRAKYTSVRLDEEAALRLFSILQAKFTGGAK